VFSLKRGLKVPSRVKTVEKRRREKARESQIQISRAPKHQAAV
jgi:hypothetical protein